jgi:hypothetical protein
MAGEVSQASQSDHFWQWAVIVIESLVDNDRIELIGQLSRLPIALTVGFFGETEKFLALVLSSWRSERT